MNLGARGSRTLVAEIRAGLGLRALEEADEGEQGRSAREGETGEARAGGRRAHDHTLVDLTGASKPPRPDPREIPFGLRGALARGLAIDPARRWPSMERLLVAIGRGAGLKRDLLIGSSLAVTIGLIVGVSIGDRNAEQGLVGPSAVEVPALPAEVPANKPRPSATHYESQRGGRPRLDTPPIAAPPPRPPKYPVAR